MSEMLKRVAVTRATMAHFAPKPFSWTKGATCVHLVRKQLVGMGHRPPPMRAFRSALTAKKALEAKGWANLSAMMDSLLPAIPPARAVAGDVVEMPSEDDVFGALAVVVGNGRIMGYFGETDMLSIVQPIVAPLAAWRT
jgi:hypothetical protein